MSTTTLFLAFLVSSACGLLYHLIRGGGFGRMLLLLVASWPSFILGHWLGEWWGWPFLRIGALNLGSALLTTLLLLLAVDILAGPARQNPSHKQG
jgi:hypothetical protein